MDDRIYPIRLDTAALYQSKRKPFSLIEKRCLLSCVQKFQDIVDEKITSLVINAKKNEAWNVITEMYNASPQTTVSTSKKQLQYCYQNLKKLARKNKLEINELLENKAKSRATLESSVTLDGYDPVDKSLFQIIPLASSDSDSITRTIKCEVIEDDYTDNNPCSMISNSTHSFVTSTPSEENALIHKVLDIIENNSNSTDCAVTSTPSEESIKEKVQDVVLEENENSTSRPTSPIKEVNIMCKNNEDQNNEEQASSSRPTSTTTSLREKMFTRYSRKRKQGTASLMAAEALHNQTTARIKQIEEEHELIKKRLNIEIESQIESEKRAEAQHKYMMERMKREDEQSEKLYAAKLKALEAKRRYFESKMDAK